MNDLPARPRLHPGIRVAPFSSGARQQTFLLSCPDGRCLEASGRLRDLLVLLDGNRSCSQIAHRLAETWNVPVREQDVRDWVTEHVLSPGLLLLPGSPQAAPGNARQGPAPGPRGVPLLSPAALAPFADALQFLFRPRLALPLLWAAGLCHLLLYPPLVAGTATAPPASPGRVLAGTLLLFLSVGFHELGHLAACRYFGCPHGEVRIGLYLIFPVLYANVSAAWRLPRRARLVVDLGGAYFQLLLTLPVYLLDRLTGDPLCALLFLELDAMILFALNPFLRFDGYWVCSDLLGVANLRARSLRLPGLLLRRLAGRRPGAPQPFLDLRLPEAAGLILYTAGSCTFTVLVLLLLARVLPDRLAALPGLLHEVAARLRGDPRPAGSETVTSLLLSLLFSLLLCFAALRMAWRGARGLVRTLGQARGRKRRR